MKHKIPGIIINLMFFKLAQSLQGDYILFFIEIKQDLNKWRAMPCS